ncbi:hypothetical protein Si004_00613 [Streptococcus infantarius subsp. infantarius]|uniref:hypothetical protein n=1 Tax=uncultured Streptococcus sp. TaxID=83427 RepID=UPI00208ED416|nr:hypothetical protein [uncultured Streptococcus sp.]MCO4640698.1 hypothetical protein [Streptococcus infantarius subsp. infantarius]MCO4645163.1 hypothetical protein [Streptococcus infantarius subsp. infantarius]MCO4662319.1 hypothetical protein [Streptococcus infantarius subsp. infantarius]MCO4670260.1 hypothetical protein [Streptococcus infantarius subsp. infantarius]MCO4677137.1 hypothetical protein [Streptococcus infantarius subsp. infantarius]
MGLEEKYDLTRNWYRKQVFIDELWHGMTMPTLNSYIRQIRNSEYAFGVKGTHGNVFINSAVFVDWFDTKIASQYQSELG